MVLIKNNMKHDWKQTEKDFYQPKNVPQAVKIPAMNFFCIKGEGNPNNDFFAEYIGVLYSLSYAIKMSPKSGKAPDNYFEYSVYPLEGVWDLNEEAKLKSMEKLDKDALVFTLMIRQPDFVTPHYANEVIEIVKKKKPNQLLDKVTFETIEEGCCVQMLHTGSYDNEPQSFAAMEKFAQNEGLHRKYKTHREIYLSDARKTAVEKLKTVLRFQID
jgi:hypothetical protein